MGSSYLHVPHKPSPHLASADWDRGACPRWRFQGRIASTSTYLLSGGIGGQGGSARKETLELLVEALARDLPRQYDRPQDLSIFDDGVAFRDPVTDISGKLPYRTMLFFTMMFFRVACKPSSSYFTVISIDTPDESTIRTVWETGATTWAGRELFISGVDDFTVNGDGRISRHDSAWDQSWDEVRRQVI